MALLRFLEFAAATAFALFDEMIADGVAPNAVTWSSLVHACARGGGGAGLERAFAAFDAMAAAGVAPNVVTYTTLIDACAKAGQTHVAYALFDSMLRRGQCHVLFLHACPVGDGVVFTLGSR